MMREITSDEVIDQAYAWLCQRRRDYSANLSPPLLVTLSFVGADEPPYGARGRP